MLITMDVQGEDVLLRYEDPGEFLLSELQEICKAPTNNCDVELICQDSHKIRTHSALLAVISPFFKTLLSDAWDPHRGASIFLPDFSGRDIQNLVTFIYTGKACLTEKEFEVFQQVVYELQIGMDENSAIILEELPKESQKDAEEVSQSVPSNNDVPTKETDPIISLDISQTSVDMLEDDVVNSIVYLCSQCGISFRRPGQLKKHKLIHKKENTSCEKNRDENSEDLIAEVELLLEDETVFKQKPGFACELCASTFHSQSKLNDHMLKHTGERPHKCPLCSKAYPVKATLTAHLRLHAEDKPHQCERCGKSFIIRSLLEQHLRTHTNERPFTCDVCGKKFRNQSNLIGHKKTHTGDRPHSCSVCHKSFNRKHDLDAHQRIHTGDKPFPCTQCTKSFRFRSALRVHLKGVHGEKTGSS